MLSNLNVGTIELNINVTTTIPNNEIIYVYNPFLTNIEEIDSEIDNKNAIPKDIKNI